MDKEQLKHLPRIEMNLFNTLSHKAVELAEIVVETQEENHPRGESFADAVTNAHGIARYEVKKSVYVIGINEKAEVLVFGDECINKDNHVAAGKGEPKRLSEIKSYRGLEKLK